MRKPLLLVAMKAAIILYFAACANVADYTANRTVTPLVTRGAWRVNLYMDANNNKTNDFAGYSFSFSNNGEVTATQNGTTVTGNWYEDNISNRIGIHFNTTDPILNTINDSWRITEVNDNMVNLTGEGAASKEILTLTNQ
jgi:hypothetical protein